MVPGVYTHSMETTYLPLVHTELGNLFMKPPVCNYENFTNLTE